ncbi:MAG: hypothetical protein ACTSSG_02700 [Candidatus Heimdallarchaeaceae archaeon]
MNDTIEDFPLYMSSVNVVENDEVILEVTYEGDTSDIEEVLLIGKNNDLSSNIAEALKFNKEEKIRAVFTISFPIWEDGTFQAVIEKEGKFIYEPGEAHNIVFRGKGVFLDLRKIYHVSKEIKAPKKIRTKKEEGEKMETSEGEEEEKQEITLPVAQDEFNTLLLKPKDFRVFRPEMKELLLQILDYLTNQKSRELVFDTVILPDIVRSLKQCIAEEGRASVYDVCFPVVILIEKALILSNMIHNQIIDEEKFERYEKEVLAKIEEARKIINATEFRRTTDLIKKEYDDDVHDLKNSLRKEI